MSSFDAQLALEQIEGDKEGLEILLSTFRRVSPQQIEDIRAAIDRGDAEELAAVAHRFKGSLGVFAAGPAAELTRRLESHARESDFASAGNTLVELEAECARLVADLTAFFEPAG